MAEEKILSGDQIEKNSGTVLSGEEGIGIVVAEVGKGAGTLKERISLATELGGLKQLPDGFDEQNGDWTAINSTNPFEVLYLDYKQNKFITSEFVRNNYDILFKFWKNKCDSIGANRDRFEKKYGIRPFEKCLSLLENAYKKLNSKEGIENYYVEINNERLRNGEGKLKNSINMMLSDASADKTEIEYCINEGLQHELTKEETAVIIKKAFDSIELKPYGAILGNTLLEKLLSVDHWMPQHKIDEAERLKREQESLKIQILPGKYASTIEEIGTILFGDINEAKEIIKEDLLKQVIAQKDVVLARDIGRISKDSKNIEVAYLEITYKLNRSLPFRFAGQKLAKTAEELCAFIFENDQTIKQGKEDIKKGYIEIWLKETNKDAYKKFIAIRDTAENLDLAFLEFCYAFNNTLPYFFAGKIFIKTPKELTIKILENITSWNNGMEELYNSSILMWLRFTGYYEIVKQWEEIKRNKNYGFSSNGVYGLGEFLGLLIPNSSYTQSYQKKLELIPIEMKKVEEKMKVEKEKEITELEKLYKQKVIQGKQEAKDYYTVDFTYEDFLSKAILGTYVVGYLIIVVKILGSFSGGVWNGILGLILGGLVAWGFFYLGMVLGPLVGTILFPVIKFCWWVVGREIEASKISINDFNSTYNEDLKKIEKTLIKKGEKLKSERIIEILVMNESQLTRIVSAEQNI